MFEIGDSVRINVAGSPSMLVIGIDGDDVTCEWKWQTTKYVTPFKADCLVLVTP